jgi:perosamine synthetase
LDYHRDEMKIPLMRPHLEADDFAAMSDAAKRGLVSRGEITRAFENTFAEWIGGAGAVATNSGTAALVLALKTLGVGRDDKVIMPSYTCVAVLNAVLEIGAVPCPVDNEYDVRHMDYNVCAADVEKYLRHRTRAIIVPHMFGVAAKIDELLQFGIPIIEDGTLALGGEYRGRKIGAWGNVSVFSLHSSKMFAAGEGGMLVANDAALVERARYLNGWDEEQPRQRLMPQSEIDFELRYTFRMSDVHAALGSSQFKKLPSFITRRHELAARYIAALQDIADIELPALDSPNVFQRFMIRLAKRTPRETIQQFMEEEIEVGRGVYPPLHTFLKESPEQFPNAERAINTLISLPLYPDLNDDEVGFLLETTKRLLSA